LCRLCGEKRSAPHFGGGHGWLASVLENLGSDGFSQLWLVYRSALRVLGYPLHLRLAPRQITIHTFLFESFVSLYSARTRPWWLFNGIEVDGSVMAQAHRNRLDKSRRFRCSMPLPIGWKHPLNSRDLMTLVIAGKLMMHNVHHADAYWFTWISSRAVAACCSQLVWRTELS
jgi:hypothetical protein